MALPSLYCVKPSGIQAGQGLQGPQSCLLRAFTLEILTIELGHYAFKACAAGPFNAGPHPPLPEASRVAPTISSNNTIGAGPESAWESSSTVKDGEVQFLSIAMLRLNLIPGSNVMCNIVALHCS